MSTLTSERYLLDTVSVTLVPEFCMFGVSAMHCNTRLSTRRFFEDFKLAASHTRLMHSLQNDRQLIGFKGILPHCTAVNRRSETDTHFATWDRVVKSSIFIEALISKHPMYCKVKKKTRKILSEYNLYHCDMH